MTLGPPRNVTDAPDRLCLCVWRQSSGSYSKWLTHFTCVFWAHFSAWEHHQNWAIVRVNNVEGTVVICDHILARTVILFSIHVTEYCTQNDSETPNNLQERPGCYALKSDSHELSCYCGTPPMPNILTTGHYNLIIDGQTMEWCGHSPVAQ